MTIALLLSLVGCAGERRQREAFRDGGFDQLLRIDAAFGLENGLYADHLSSGERVGQAACWQASLQLRALAAAARIDPRWKELCNAFADAMDMHSTTVNGIAGYDSQPFPAVADRFYDDNAWMAIALIDSYEATRDPNQRRRAETALAMVLTGEDDRGGGIRWHEQEPTSRRACANAPAILACLRVYSATGEAKYRAAADSVYEWTRANLTDVDGLYFDCVTADGETHVEKFLLNAAAMMLVECAYFETTLDPAHLDRARKTCDALRNRFIDENGRLKGETVALAITAEAMLELCRQEGNRDARRAAAEVLEHLKRDCTRGDGWLAAATAENRRAPSARVRLIDQSAAARAMLMFEITR